jgi:NAD(P)-dependent dehydrogenase (short-subunit alcohol dehydrogenase family)
MALALVTGSSSGIGPATAVSLARTGRTVVATMRNLDRGGDIKKIAEKEKLPIHLAKIDVDDDNSVGEGFAKIVTEHGPIDVLVNNAGNPRRRRRRGNDDRSVSAGDGDEFLRRASLRQSRHPKHAGTASRDDRQRHLGRWPRLRGEPRQLCGVEMGA